MNERYKGNETYWSEYSLVEHLKNTCSKDEKYKNLYAVWTLDQETHARALSAIYYNFPHYSMHGESHSLSIINKIEMLLGEDRIRSLSPTDTFLILESAYLHDIGMIVSQKELLEEWKKPSFERFLKNLEENNSDVYIVEAAKYLLEMQKSETPFKDNDWPVKVRRYVTAISSEYYRGKHSVRSADFIKEGSSIGLNSNYNKLIPNRLIVLLQKIAISHGTNFEDSFNELEQFDNGIGTDVIHPRFIASLLRLGDLLDLDDGRFNEVFEKVEYFPDSSKAHKEKHKSITLFLVSPEKIQVSAVCKDPNSYRETRAWFDWLKEEVKNLSSRWSDIVPKGFKGGPPSLGNIKLTMEGSENIKEQLDLQSNIDPQRAFELIEGQGIYSDKLIFIRELIQNAMDATKIQMWKDIRYGKYDGVSQDLLGIDEVRLKEIKNKKDFEFPSDLPEKIKRYYPINISIDYDEDKEELEFTIEDRGCGININDLKRMEKVGGSWNQDRELIKLIDEMPEFLQPTGNFGIGLHSVFLVTDELEIKTKSEDDIGYDLTFVSRRKNGYITVKEYKEKKIIGTKITLRIKGKAKIGDCINSIDIDCLSKIYDIQKNFDIFEKNLDKQLVDSQIVLYTEETLDNMQMLDIYINKNRYSKHEINPSEMDNNTYIDQKIDEYATFKKRSTKLMDIEISDKKEGIKVIVQGLDEEQGYHRYDDTFNFKGIYCKEPRQFGLRFFCYNISIYKGKTKDILGVSRDCINKEKLKNIRNRIELELMPEIMKKLGESICCLDSLDKLDELGNKKISMFLFAYKKYTGDYLEFKNIDISKKIIMGELHKIVDDEKIKSEKICYKELINIKKIICIETRYVINSLNHDEIYDISKEKYSDINYICSKYNYEFDRELYLHIKQNFCIHTILEFVEDKVIILRVRNNQNFINFSEKKYRERYMKSIINLNSRHLIPPIKSIKSNAYKILYVNIHKNKLSINHIGDVPVKYDKFIISPLYNVPEGYFLERDIDYIIEFLKRYRFFNELIDCVAENSLEKENYIGKDIKADIENAYREFIQECIDAVKSCEIEDEEINTEKIECENIIESEKDISGEEVALTVGTVEV
ncbi:HD domain-containing protein [Paraclostridium tenue]|uniref:HD-CE domain-containing protein n=1 Tax=Paraclostridium tenue TaxID=1737 RepID=A0ABP3XEG2_9FIRM